MHDREESAKKCMFITRYGEKVWNSCMLHQASISYLAYKALVHSGGVDPFGDSVEGTQ